MAKQKGKFGKLAEEYGVRPGTDEYRQLKQTYQELVPEMTKLKNLSMEIYENIGLQANYARDIQLSTKEQTDSIRKQRRLLSDVRGIASEVAELQQDGFTLYKKELPYADKLKEIENDILTIKETGSGLRADEKSQQLKTLEDSRQELLYLQSQAAVMQRQRELQDKSLELFGLTRNRVQEIGDTIESVITNPWLMLIGLIGLAIHKLQSYHQTLAEIRQDSGLTRDSMERISEISKDIVYSNRQLGLEFEDVAKIATEFTKQGESTLLLNKELVGQVAKYSKTMGLSADAGAKLTMNLQSAGLAQQEIVDSFDEALQLSNIYGVSVSEVMGDVAESFESGYEYASQYPRELIKTAARARAVGLSMKKLLDISESLLDVESSVQAEMEAVLLTGKNINLDAARYYALTGQTNKLSEEILKNIGSVEEFSKMLPLQQQTFAKALGMSTEELANMARRYERIQRIESGRGTQQDRIQQSLEDQLNSVEKIETAFKAVYGAVSILLLPILEPIADVLGVLASLVSAATNELSGVGGFISALIVVSTLTGLIKLGWKTISGTAAYAGKKLSDAMTKNAKQGGLMDSIFGGNKQQVPKQQGGNFLKSFQGFMKAADPKTMLAAGAAMILIATAMWILAKALQEFSTGVEWEGLGMAAAALGGLLIAMVVLAKLSPLVIIGAVALGVMSGAIWILGDAMQKIASSADGFEQIMTTLMGLDAGKLADISWEMAKLSVAMGGFAVAAATLGTVGAVFGGVGGKKEDKLDTVIEKLDIINETLSTLDLTVELDGAKVNKGLAFASRHGVK